MIIDKINARLKVAMKVMLGPIGLLMGKEIPNLLWMMNPLNYGKLLIKSFFPPKGEESSGKKPSVSAVNGGGDDKPSGVEKQEKALISANQKKGYEGVMEEIESYAPYEDGVKEPIKVSVPSSSSKGKGSGGQQEGSLKVITVGGGGEDPFEVLGAFG